MHTLPSDFQYVYRCTLCPHSMCIAHCPHSMCIDAHLAHNILPPDLLCCFLQAIQIHFSQISSKSLLSSFFSFHFLVLHPCSTLDLLTTHNHAWLTSLIHKHRCTDAYMYIHKHITHTALMNVHLSYSIVHTCGTMTIPRPTGLILCTHCVHISLSIQFPCASILLKLLT